MRWSTIPVAFLAVALGGCKGDGKRPKTKSPAKPDLHWQRVRIPACGVSALLPGRAVASRRNLGEIVTWSQAHWRDGKRTLFLFECALFPPGPLPGSAAAKRRLLRRKILANASAAPLRSSHFEEIRVGGHPGLEARLVHAHGNRGLVRHVAAGRRWILISVSSDQGIYARAARKAVDSLQIDARH